MLTLIRRRPVVVAAAALLVAVAVAAFAVRRGDDDRVATSAPATSTTTTSTTTSTTSTSTTPTTEAAATTITTTVASAPTTAAPPSTAPTTSAAPRTPGSVAGAIVAIDPGHNEQNWQHPDEINRQVDIGNGQKACDTTGTSTDDGYSEAAFTTDVAARVAAILRAAGATVVLTRDASTPWGPCIDRRAGIANEAGAAVAVSIHADGGPASGRGFHVIEPAPVAGHNEAIVEPSARLGSLLRSTYESATGLPRSTYAGSDGIDVRDDLGGLNLSTVPKVFVETGNMRKPPTPPSSKTTASANASPRASPTG